MATEGVQATAAELQASSLMSSVGPCRWKMGGRWQCRAYNQGQTHQKKKRGGQNIRYRYMYVCMYIFIYARRHLRVGLFKTRPQPKTQKLETDCGAG